jgi:hypothetical protein
MEEQGTFELTESNDLDHVHTVRDTDVAPTKKEGEHDIEDFRSTPCS